MKRKGSTEAFDRYVPLFEWNRAPWDLFVALNELRGETGEVRISDFAAHLDLVGIRDYAERLRCYRGARALLAEWSKLSKDSQPKPVEKPEGSPDGA